jgi:hypothetical protein
MAARLPLHAIWWGRFIRAVSPRGTISKPLVTTEEGGCADGGDNPRLNETCDSKRHGSEGAPKARSKRVCIEY